MSDDHELNCKFGQIPGNDLQRRQSSPQIRTTDESIGSMNDYFGETKRREKTNHNACHSVIPQSCVSEDPKLKLEVLKERKDMMTKTRNEAVRQIEGNEGAKVIVSDSDLRSTGFQVDFSKMLFKGTFAKIYAGQDNVGHDAVVKVYEIKNLDSRLGFRIKNSGSHLRYLSQHRNTWIVHVMQVVVSPEKFYVFMKKIGCGINLTERLKSFSEQECLQVSKDLSRGLVFLHERGIAHDDLCGKHVFFDSQDNPVIGGLDYSVVYIQSNGNHSRVVKQQASSKDHFQNHWSPEKTKDDLYDPSKADVWSFGVVFLQMLTKQVRPIDPKSHHRLDIQWKQLLSKNHVQETDVISRVCGLCFVTDSDLRADILHVCFAIELHHPEI